MKIFTLADVHSFYEPMMTALNDNGFDINNPDHHIVVCGDLFDRGPDAKKVLEFFVEFAKTGRFHYVMGNHEDLLFDLLCDLQIGSGIRPHHVDNGTLDTICQIADTSKWDLVCGYANTAEFANKMKPIADLIYQHAKDYVEFGDYIFVHGWIPYDMKTSSPLVQWRTGDWYAARWPNGMQAWSKGIRVPGKTIVCGHWHCSWGHSHLHQDRKEWPQKNRTDWQKSFEPFVDEGIIALDACTAYTGFCNCFVLAA
jgi:serine/threonine protein phosphatase 1